MKQKILFLFALFTLLSNREAYTQTPELPDNIVEACSVTPPALDWGIKVGWSSSPIVSTFNIPMVGDMDGDGIPEIVCFANEGRIGTDAAGMKLNTVLIYNGKTKNLTKKFSITGYVTCYNAAAYGLVKRPDDRKGLFVVACDDMYLRAYDITGTLIWTSNALYGVAGSTEYAVNVGFADFNQDGYPEVYVRNKIFDASTGILLATATGGTNAGAVWTHHSNNTGHKLSSPIAADVTGDSKMELILGNEIYKVDITNRTGTGGNSIVREKTVTPPSPAIADGFAQAIDFNKDGYLDILIVTRSNATISGTVAGYVWDVHNNAVSTPFSIATNWAGVSFPLVADVNSDGELEILIQAGVSGDAKKYSCYKYDATAMTFSLLWRYDSNENTFSNGATLFDFNQDGKNEILISDQVKIAIVNASGTHHVSGLPTGPYAMAALNYGQTTVMQYPVVADVDADGSAEIILVGAPGGVSSTVGVLSILESHNEANPWAPARKVWNQYAYNSLNVNEDLTIPRYPITSAARFAGPDRVLNTPDDVRPFNNILQQQTMLDQYGMPLWLAPNGQIVGTPVFSYDETSKVMTVTVKVQNVGDAAFKNPFYLTAYKNSIGSTPKYTHTYANPILVGETATITFGIANFGETWGTDLEMVISLNDNGNGSMNQETCGVFIGSYNFGFIKVEECQEKPVTLTNNKTLSGTMTYQWKSSTDGVTWIDITGATNSSYTTTDNKPGTYYYKVEVNNGTDTIDGTITRVRIYPCVMPVNPNIHLYK